MPLCHYGCNYAPPSPTAINTAPENQQRIPALLSESEVSSCGWCSFTYYLPAYLPNPAERPFFHVNHCVFHAFNTLALLFLQNLVLQQLQNLWFCIQVSPTCIIIPCFIHSRTRSAKKATLTTATTPPSNCHPTSKPLPTHLPLSNCSCGHVQDKSIFPSWSSEGQGVRAQCCLHLQDDVHQPEFKGQVNGESGTNR